MEANRTPSTALMILQLLGYVLAFAVPATTAALLLPAYAPWIVLSALVLLVSVSAFLVGWEWDDPRWTAETRRYARGLIFLMIVVAPIAAISDTIQEPDRWLVHATAAAVMVILVPVMTLAPFYLGRAIQRRRRAPA